MIDYLEELLEHTGDLLEEVRRSEGRLVSPGRGETAEAASTLSEGGKTAKKDVSEKREGKMSPALLESKRAGERSEVSALSGEEVWRAEAELSGKEPRSGEPPLLEQLEKMERAVLTAERTGLTERSAGSVENAEGRERFPVSLPGPDGATGFPGGVEGAVPGWTPVLAAERGALTLEEDWAERADRAFRRDSRRYDGGFYLY